MNLKFLIQLNVFFIMCLLYVQGASAQMQVDGTTLYGDEWINYGQSYYKINVSEDGMYRIGYDDLASAGVFSGGNTPSGNQMALYRLGEEVPIYVSTTGPLGGGDYIEFYGLKNRGEVDIHLYETPDNQLNPRYSLFSNESTYFLTWRAAANPDQMTDTPNNLSSPPAAEPYCWQKEVLEYGATRINGQDYGSSSYRCAYDLGEGYANGTFSINQNHIITSPNATASGPDAKLTARWLSGNGTHTIDATLNGNPVYTENYSGWTMKQMDASIPASDLNDGNNTLNIVGSGSVEDDKFRVAFVDLEYARSFDFSGLSSNHFTLPDAAGDRYLEISNFNHGGTAPILYDLSNKLRITTTLDGGEVKALLPAAAGDRELVLVAGSSYMNPVSITERQFVQYDFEGGDYDYIILTHPALMDDGAGNNYVQQYADYRASMPGGEYTPIIVDVTQLYDQFGYGIVRHEQAIKNFLKKAHQSWSSKLLLIIGKGITYALARGNAPEWMQYDLVPSYGFPSSDHLFVTDHNTTSPWMGVGRIAAKNPDQIRMYLEKVIEYEDVHSTNAQTYEERAWMKRILHFGGGDENIQNFIKNELNNLKDSIENSTLGADVTSFFKNSTDVVQTQDLDQVVPLINDGALMLTFFGHSAPSTLDFDLGNPQEYNNQGKYPFFYAIGCSTNRIFEVESSLSEDYVFVEDKGCIGFFGATWITSLGNLVQYGRYFYDNLGNDHYGATIGEVIKATIDDYSFNNSYTAELLRNGLILHGDPAVKLYNYDTPDYIVNEAESAIEPSIVNAEQDSFNLHLVINNLGRDVPDSINIRLGQQLPDGSMEPQGIHRVATPPFEGLWTYRLPLAGANNNLGLNELQVSLDIDDEVYEAPMEAEMNNNGSLSFFVVSNDIFPTFPTDFAIISDPSPTLQSSTANAFSENLKYYFEIDTSELFNSPIKQSLEQNSEGGVLSWQPSIPMMHETVYYWRVSIDSTAIAGSGFNWHGRSFVYLDDSPPGWNQSHYYQYQKDTYSEMTLEADREFQYSSLFKELSVKNAAYWNLGLIEVALFVDGFKEFTSWPCPAPNDQLQRIIAAVFDDQTLELIRNPASPGDFEYPNCYGSDVPVKKYMFHPINTEERQKFIDFVNDVEQGDYVVIFTTQVTTNDYFADEWAADSIALGTNIFQVLEQQGAELVRNLETQQTPYILMFKKDDPNYPISEVHAADINDIIENNYSIEGLGVRGDMTSTLIGPAASWESLLWEMKPDFDPATELANVDIYGVDAQGVETLLMDSITTFDYSLEAINAQTYPYIRMVHNSSDSTGHTAPMLNYWRVLYNPIPEAALAANKHFVFHNDTLQQGEPLRFEIAIENVSNADMDSLLVHYTVIDSDNSETLVAKRMAPLPADNILQGELDFETRLQIGNNRLIIEVNPNNDQPELHHYNNIGIKEFFVQADQRNPLLDVTFDGIHIMDGDIVSAQPEIFIDLKDENQFLTLNDTSVLRVFVLDPLGEWTEYHIDGSALIFFPAEEGADNTARMEFRPEFTQDGVYELRVKGEDITGNDSGELDYRISFEVINEEMVSNVLNYPNPFSTSTQFVFTLTGNELPDYMKIQIMTVSGKVVREIGMEELGPLRIGNNITDFRWDGTDEYGDQLANGVYLYRVVVQKDGTNYDNFNVGTNQYFKNGFGKMMILR